MAWRSLILEDEIQIYILKRMSVYFELMGEKCPKKWNLDMNVVSKTPPLWCQIITGHP